MTAYERQFDRIIGEMITAVGHLANGLQLDQSLSDPDVASLWQNLSASDLEFLGEMKCESIKAAL